MAKYLGKVNTLLHQFKSYLITCILCSENNGADALARLTSGNDMDNFVSFPIEWLE